MEKLGGGEGQCNTKTLDEIIRDVNIFGVTIKCCIQGECHGHLVMASYGRALKTIVIK